MNLPSYARAAARLLREIRQPDHVPSAAARARSLSTIERALATKQERERRLWLATAAAAAAVFVLVVIGIASRMASPPGQDMVSLSVAARGSGASVTDTRGTHALTDQVELAAGSSVSTSKSGRAVFHLSTGTRLALGTAGHISVASVDRVQRFRLTQGALDAHVAKLKSGERFVIETLDAAVEVRGTAFRVTILDLDAACAGGGRTRVRVTEGVVNVRSRGKSIDVRAGASWPAQCSVEPRPSASAHDGAQQKIVVDAERRPKGSVAAAPRFESTASREPRSELRPITEAAASEGIAEPEPPQRAALSHQNDKFELAVRTRQRGDHQSALGLYRDFIREFPASPLAQNARVEVMRLLARSNKTAAAKAASDYLTRYPTGFAREEAERIIAAP